VCGIACDLNISTKRRYSPECGTNTTTTIKNCNELKRKRSNLDTLKIRKSNWIGHIWRRNCLLNHLTEGKIEGRIEMTARRGKRRQQLLDKLKERRGYRKLKEEKLNRTM